MTEAIPQKVSVFLVDDQPMVLKGLRALLGCQPELAVCGEALDATSAWEGIAATRPRVVVADLSLGGDDGVQLIQRLHQQRPEIKVLVFSMHGDRDHIRRAFQAGALGYITKPEGADRIVEAIQFLIQGKPLSSHPPGFLDRDRSAPACPG